MGVKKTKKYSKQGKKNRAKGIRVEAKVREDLEDKGWIVDKWTNNIELEKNKVIKAKRKYNPYLRALSIGNGFPDFICFKLPRKNSKSYEIIGIEVKSNGYLDKEEREKCLAYLNKKTFLKIFIAKPIKNGRNTSIEYIDFEKKYPKGKSKKELKHNKT